MRFAQKGDQQLIQQLNRLTVLDVIRGKGAISRAAIARETHLSPTTITNIVDHLMQQGLVVETELVSMGLGRRPMLLEFNPRGGVLIGAHLDVGLLIAAAMYLDGTIIEQRRVAVSEKKADVVLNRVAESIAALMADLGQEQERVLGVGLGIPGAVSWPEGVSIFSPNLGWRSTPVRAILEERLGCLVLVDNEVKMVALGEASKGAGVGISNFACLAVGTGVGGAVVTQGRLFRGANNSAGEIGHTTLNPLGPICSCGNSGCLEAYTSERAILSAFRRGLPNGTSSEMERTPSDCLSLEDVFEADRRGDQLAQKVIDETVMYLGIGVANIIDSFDPNLVILAGKVFDLGDGLLERVQQVEQRRVFEALSGGVRLVTGQLGEMASVIGAAMLVFSECFKSPVDGRGLSALPAVQEVPG